MTTPSPITPPPELVQQWEVDTTFNRGAASSWTAAFAARAAQWGADQELEACCELMDRDFMAGPSDLRAARRPKPPSLKEQALEILRKHVDRGYLTDESSADADTIRRALEQLDD
jgi:hypothetical protein